MIRFKVIKWKNLLSTGNTFTEIVLDKVDNTLIVGENGSGKSTFLDALCYALYGRAFRNINKPTLVNSINKKKCLVELDFETLGSVYKIRRGIKPGIFEIYKDSTLINPDSDNRDYQKFLEKNILKMSFKSFTQIIIGGSASFTPFMQLKAADRRSIIEDLLDIKIFSTMNVLAKQKFIKVKEDIDRQRFELKLLDEKRTFITNNLKSLRKNNVSKIQELNQELTGFSNELSVVSSEIDELIGKKNELINDPDKLKKLRSKHHALLKLQSQIEVNEDTHKKHVHFYSKNDSCPTCKQAIDSAFRTGAISKAEASILELQEGQKQLIEKINSVVNEIVEHEEVVNQINEYDVKILTKQNRLRSLNEYIKKLETQIKTMNQTDSIVESNENDLIAVDADIERIKMSVEDLTMKRSYLDFATSMLKDSGIKSRIIRQYLPIINTKINKYLSDMEFFVNFTIDENFEEIIKSRHRDKFSYENFSEGEKSRIDLALMLTWRAIAKMKNSVNTNLFVLDETFDGSLDNAGTDFLLSVLQSLKGVNVFVISHKKDILTDKFHRTITFEKVKGFSKIQ